MSRYVLPLLLLAPSLAAAQPATHDAGCKHDSSRCAYSVYDLKRGEARKANDLPAMVANARYGVRLFRRESKAIRDRHHVFQVLNTLLRLHEDAKPTTAAERKAVDDARKLLGQHYGWRELAGKWRNPDDIYEVMGWEKRGSRWWPKEAWKLRKEIDTQHRLVKRKINETGGDISGLQSAEDALVKLEERRRKLAGQKRQAEGNLKKAKKSLPRLRKETEKLRKVYDADTSNEKAKKAWQLALLRVRGAQDDIMLEELRLKDLKKLEKRLPRDVKKAKKELRKARKKLGPGYRKVAPALKKLDTLKAKQAGVIAKAEAELKDEKLIEKRLLAADKTPKKR